MAANRTTNIILAVAIGAAALAAVALFVLGDRGEEPDLPRVDPAADVQTPVRPPTPPGVRRVPDTPPPVGTEAWQVRESGLKVYDVVVGTGDSPQTGSGISLEYTGWLETGESFDSSYLRSEPVELLYVPGRILKGWEEGLSDMKVGGRRVLQVPPELAFGQGGAPQRNVPASATLTYEIELVSVTSPRQAPEAPPAVPADGWTTTESGLAYHVLSPGTGDPPQAGQRVVVEYTGWLETGERFDSSLERPGPLDIRLGEVIEGWTEGIGAMTVGERRVLRVPPALGYGEKGRHPIIPGDATLTYDVELVEIR